MDDERIQAILSAVNNRSNGSGVTEESIRSLLASNSEFVLLNNEILASFLISTESAFQRGLQLNRNTSGRQQQMILPPEVAPTTASSLDNSSAENRAKKQKYDEDILPQILYENSFVHVKSYLHFVEGCARATAEGQQPKDEAKNCFGPEAYSLWCPFENLTCPKETKRSLALCRAFGKELNDEVCLDVQHQVPISPTQKKLKQDADLCFFFQSDDMHEGERSERIIAVLEYKPSSEFPAYESQACAYGTDLMSINNSPIVIIQAHGIDLDKMYFRAFGVVPSRMTNDSEHELRGSAANYRKTLLFEGHACSGFAAIAAGLRKCVACLKQDGYFDSFSLETKVSSVASIHRIGGVLVFSKSYDYRLRPETAMGNRRHANAKLIRHFIDKDAKYFQLGENLEVVICRFFEQDKNQKEWYAPFPVSNLRLILDALADLHEQGYVHGDIRLFNFLLHVGKLVDFDHTRKAGEFYPNTLRLLEVDGKRAQAVTKAIMANSLSSLKMDATHDLESMKHALQLLQPTTDAPKDFADWWKAGLGSDSVLSLRQVIEEKFSGPTNQLEFNISIKNYLGDNDPALTATDSPGKSRNSTI
mmetsp:Transcript_7486/g.11525  ORF Transcript_7486/g.11525 Transcript_7486/m.11525 type:complete len:590 (+) Transcript_7486:152-1921(+)|eukprot:CAMPEP_0118688672 /NCGR_PEP_ID=MMETSP0800-20121206/9051_1 /TAXON_ID=210618 ORGANISM="Striatella unipunctata, Strain CCMP2910" /NCGR_SAMPLE_ID=MMETSP0800 /ASSEMBLY_ACC=CAM_ASM_000638 /LENGTH=589 /DNA_ID=CAMNT_0006585959 /DNA_START=131 /DNA_END=1900 /DNA_ORIENTATION=-